MAGEVPNKIIYNGDTILDVSQDTAVESDVVAGKTFHLSNGLQSTGTAEYLPLSAGSDEKLTGPLYLDVDSGATDIIFHSNGVAVADILYNSGSFSFNTRNGDSRLGRFYLDSSGNVRLGANGPGQIYFRPYGALDNTNQVVIKTNGQITGGHPMTDTSNTAASKAVNANTWTECTHVSSLESGVYMAYGYIKFTPNTNSGGILQLALASGTSSAGGQAINSVYFNGATAREISVPFLADNTTSIYLYVKSTVKGTVNLYRIRHVRLS